MNPRALKHLFVLGRGVLICGFRAIGLAFFFCGGQLTQASDELPASVSKGEEASIDWELARQFWAFQAPEKSDPPSVSQSSWLRTKIDAFILSTMEAKGLSPAAESHPGVLVRRLSFDLTGLPPEYHEVKAFLKKHDDRAYELRVDSLLDSLHFGERMAAIWMNLARYAEDQAHQVGNDTKHFYPNAYLYRDWVVQAFNDDLPYDRFIELQLAADFNEQDLKHHIAALGFLGLGPKYYNRGRLEVQAEEWADRVDTVTRTFLGLTVACARCHDHKYDPITSADYYALAGVFAGTKMVNHPMKELELQEGKDSEGNKSDEKDKKKETPKPEETIHIVEEGEPRDLNVFIRGDVNRKGELVPRRFLQILCNGEPKVFHDGSGRKELAEAISDPTNPLTARVMVNRVWGMLLGHPLVRSPSNFGKLGERATHPRLLDDLAVQFMENGWSVKWLVRGIVMSATYRQSSRSTEMSRKMDPENRWLSHMNRKRLTVEMWRDAVLSASGELESRFVKRRGKMVLTGGKSFLMGEFKNRRRTLYGRISRLELNNFMRQFDYPDPNVHQSNRPTTTTPMQKLFVLNNPFMFHHAAALDHRLDEETDGTMTEKIKQAYRLTYSREPMPEELDLATEFLSASTESDLMVSVQYVQMLLASNEMLYLD